MDSAKRSPVFLGVLRSEFDSADEVAALFARAEELTESVLDAWVDDVVSAADAATVLAAGVLVTGGGVRWVMGATTRRWYRKDSGDHPWRVAAPPAVLDAGDERAVSVTVEAFASAVAALLGGRGAPAAAEESSQEFDGKDLSALLGEGYG